MSLQELHTTWLGAPQTSQSLGISHDRYSNRRAVTPGCALFALEGKPVLFWRIVYKFDTILLSGNAGGPRGQGVKNTGAYISRKKA